MRAAFHDEEEATDWNAIRDAYRRTDGRTDGQTDGVGTNVAQTQQRLAPVVNSIVSRPGHVLRCCRIEFHADSSARRPGARARDNRTSAADVAHPFVPDSALIIDGKLSPG